MAITGLLLVGFLVSHVGGNSLLLASDEGEAYNAYAAKLQSFGPLLWVARLGLAALFLTHIYLGLRVSAQNRTARGSRQQVRSSSEARSFSSSSMLVTGLMVLVFLLAHLWHFSFDRRFASQGADLVKETLQGWGVLTLYTIGIVSLWVHLWHALPSAFQTLGVTHPRWSRMHRYTSRSVISAVSGLFLAILLFTFLGR